MNLTFLRIGGPLSVLVAFAICTALMAVGVTRELPIGSVNGSVRLVKSGRVVPNATIVLRPVSWHGEDLQRTRTAKCDVNGSFHFRNILAGQYTIEAFSKAHSLGATPVTIVEGENTNLDLEMKPTMADMTLNISQHVFTPSEQPEFQIRGFTNSSTIEIVLYRINFGSVAKKGSLRDLLEPVVYDYDHKVNLDNSPDFQKLTLVNWEIKNRDGEGIFDERIKYSTLEEGYYWIKLQTPESSRSTWLAVSRIALVAKVGGVGTTAYVCDIESGQPVTGAQISRPTKTGSTHLGATGADGTLRFDNGTQEGSQAIFATVGNSHALSSYYVSSARQSSAKIWTYTDRPVYRPGDSVNFKGIIRTIAGRNYAVPRPGSVTVELRDPNDNVVEAKTLPLDARGTFAGEVQLDADVVGSYTLLTRFGSAKESKPLQVLAYRKPEFKISVTPERPYFTTGERIRMKVKCDYYFGGPVPGARINASVYSAPIWNSWSSEDSEEFGDDYYNWTGDYVGQVSGVTNDNGTVTLEFVPPKDRVVDDWTALDSIYTFEVNGTETGDKYFDASGKVKVVQGEISLQGEFDSYFIAPGKPATLSLRARYQDGSPAKQQEIWIEQGELDWSGNTAEFRSRTKLKQTTNDNGDLQLTASPPQNGTFVVRCQASDKVGNTIRAEFTIWVWEDGSTDSFGPAPKLQLVLDKKQYEPGESASVLLRTDKPGGSVLITVESDEVLWKRVIPMSSETARISVPVSGEYSPVSYVSATRVHKKQFAIASRRLTVEDQSRKLQISILPDKSVLEPRQEVTYRIQTRDSSGKPVSADLSLGVVDEAIYAIREDTDDPVKAFYPRRSHSVQTVYSFPELYLDGGDKDAESDIERSQFLDTAAWFPHVITNAAGIADVSVKLPDNLTSWRATVVGSGPQNSFGKAIANITVRKPLMVRLSVPVSMVVGDQIRISATIHNDSGADADVKVSLRTDSITVAEEANQSIRVLNNSKQEVSWNATASTLGIARVSLSGQITNGPSDAMRLEFPVVAHGREIVSGESGAFQRALRLTINRIHSAEQGRVRVSVSPTLLGGVIAALDDLVDYPYGCTEQTMSRFMPAMVVAKLLQDLSMQRPEIMAKLPQITRQSLAKLKTYQHSDGGWGWWETDESSPEMTALVLEGLYRAGQAGVEIESTMIERGLNWAIQWLKAQTDVDDNTIRIAYAVQLHGRDTAGASAFSKVTLDKLGDEAVAIYVLLAKEWTGSGDNVARTEQAKKAYARLMSAAQRSGGVLHWNDQWNSMATARALQAMLLTDPTSTDIPKVIRYLMERRQGRIWSSTSDTAQVLVVLSQRLKDTKELANNSSVEILINGELLKSYTFSSQNLSGRPLTIDIPIGSLRETNDLELRTSGNASCYYTVETRQTPQEETIGALVNGSGLTIERTYHRIIVEKMEDGTSRLTRDERPTHQFKSGDVVRCVLKIQASKPASFVMIEVPTPANLRVSENSTPEVWSWWWSAMSIFDSRVVLFATNVAAGTNILEFNMRAEAPGTCVALPGNIYEMYAPDRQGSSDSVSIEVRP